MTEFIKDVLASSKKLQDEVSDVGKPPYEILPPRTQKVLSHSLVQKTRGYIERVVYQINSTYENACYDACAVMIRRLVETLIIEAFEQHNIASKIQNANGDFLYLRDMITITLNETSWNLSRNTKRSLPRLKDIGDLSAHNRRFNAHRTDIDSIVQDLRIVIQEFLYLAKLK